MSNKSYSAPRLVAHGKLEDLTHGVSTGTSVDAIFISVPGQPQPNFTFT